LVFLMLLMHPFRPERGFDRHWFDSPEQFPRDRGIDPRTAESHAPRQAHHKVWLVTAIDRSALRIASVGDAEPSSASSAGHDAREQRSSASPGLDASGTAVIVEGELLLIALELVPGDVAFVMILNHHFPRPKGFAVSVASSCPSIDDGGALLALSVNIDSCVERILENCDDVAITNRHPFEAGHAAFVGGPGEMDLISLHRKQYLARAAELPEAREDESDHFLEAQVRIKTKSHFAMPDVTERN